jgi:HD-like signal output (HDOD) protein
MSQADAAAEPDLTALAAQFHSELAAGTLDLPLLPSVAAEVLSSSLDDHADAARLAELIQQDQALATHVLRVVNSPAFRGAIEIVALQQAIARLGMERIREIALSASLKGALFEGGRYQVVADESWQIALAAGLWSKEIARACRKNVEMAYLSGLLHNIGVPLVLHRIGQLAPELSRQAVDQLMSQLVQPAGVVLAREWQLPGLVAVTIEHLNDFAAAGDDADAVAVAATGSALGNWMCTRGILISEVNALASTQHLGLYPDDVAAILEQMDDIRVSLESMNI